MDTQRAPLDCQDFDIHDLDYVLDPGPIDERLRRECPVARGKRHGGYWLLSRYSDVREAARDWHTYSSAVVGVTAIPVITPRVEAQLPIEVDPPDHSTFRLLMNPVFAPARVAELRPQVVEVAANALQGAIRNPAPDLARDYAAPVSLLTLAIFTGLPAEDATRWAGWIRRMFDIADPASGAAASAEFGDYIDDLIAARRMRRTGDFLSVLMDAEIAGRRLTDGELHRFCRVVFGAGFETTQDALSVMLCYLAGHPAVREQVRKSPGVIPTAVEEFLRWATPIRIFGRNATRDVAIHGTTIPAHDVVALGFGAANHDPDAFEEPDRCILDRTPNPHLAFGAGPHLCLGAPVARLELAVTLELFCCGSSPPFALDPAREISWKTRGDRRGLTSVPVIFDPSTDRHKEAV